jgi:ribonuclease H / adenosylcobalamin/alpha-ribazole phosphatase
VIIFCDGGCFSNPGPAVWAFVVREHEGGEIIRTESGYLSDPESTNNVAEYRGLIEALTYAAIAKPHTLQLRSDSKLIVNQVNGVWSAKHDSMIMRCAEAQVHIDKLRESGITVDLQHVHREENVEADAECNRLKEEILQSERLKRN